MGHIEVQRPPAATPHRHGCLSALIILFGLLSLSSVTMNLVLHDKMVELAESLPNRPLFTSELVLVQGLLALFMVLVLAALWFWQRWAFYVYVVLAVSAMLLNLLLLGLKLTLPGLIGMILLVGLVMRQWDDFR